MVHFSTTALELCHCSLGNNLALKISNLTPAGELMSCLWLLVDITLLHHLC